MCLDVSLTLITVNIIEKFLTLTHGYRKSEPKLVLEIASITNMPPSKDPCAQIVLSILCLSFISTTLGFTPTSVETVSSVTDKSGDEWTYNWFQDDADIRPVDALVFIGETLTVYCVILEATENVYASELSFVLTPRTGSSWSIKELVVVDDKTTYTNITVSESFQQHTTLECVAGVRILRSTFIYAEKPIQAIRQFTGVYHYQKSIEVTWELAQDYLDDSSIGVEIDWLPYSSPENSSQTLLCSSSSQLSCTIDGSQYYGQDILFFRVNVFSRKWWKRPSAEYLELLYPTNVTSLHMFLVRENTKPGPPTNVQVINRTSSCLWLAWDNPDYLVDCTLCEKEYEAELIDEENTAVSIKQTSNSTPAFNTKFEQLISVCGLELNVKYTVRLRVRDKKSLWSDWVEIESYPEDYRPLYGPKVRTTSYYKEDCHHNKRNVIVYWTTPEERSLRGTLVRFELNVANVTYSLPPDTRSFKLSLACSSSHTILIFSVTNLGLSYTPSEIYVPMDKEELTEPKISGFRILEEFSPLVSATLKNLTVAWGHVNIRDETLVIYMCHENVEPFTCYNDYAAMDVDVNVRRLLLTNVPTTQNLFGFALQQTDGRKRGINWTSCVYQSDKVPSKLTDVRVAPGNRSGTLEVTWLATSCNRKTKAYIQKYIIYTCPSSDVFVPPDMCPFNTVTAHAERFLVDNLHYSTKYTVYIRAVGPELHLLSPLSDPVSAITGSESTKLCVTEKKYADDSKENKTIYMVIIVTLVLMLLIIACIVLWFRCRRDCCLKSLESRKSYSP